MTAGSHGGSGEQPTEPGAILTELQAVLRDRAERAPADSYSVTLMADAQLASRKIVEEAFEVVWELGRPRVDHARVASEAADLLFHLLAGLVGAGVELEDVWAELAARRRSPAQPPVATGAPGAAGDATGVQGSGGARTQGAGAGA